MNRNGQFSIIAALLVSVIMIATVMSTYSIITSNPVQSTPLIQDAVQETNLAIKQILGFTVGYYGSVLTVSGNTSYARIAAANYMQSGLANVARMHPEWATCINAGSPDLSAYWFADISYSKGEVTVAYNLTGLGITGVNLKTSCKLAVTIMNATGNQAYLSVVKDEDEPLVNLGKQSFKFYRYENSAWKLTTPNTDPTVYANGSYQMNVPAGVDSDSYVVQVEDQRGIIVVASTSTSYTYNLTWPSVSPMKTTHYYANGTSDVDSSPDKGTHSNFTAQRCADDISDTLTEGGSSNTSVYYPSSYNLLGSTRLVSGTISNLQADDGVYMAFRSYQSASTGQALYAHSETTTIGGLTYYLQKLISAEGSATSLTASMSATGRQLFGKFVYPLTGVTSIPASIWTTHYRAWKDADQTIAYDATSSLTQSSSQTYISWTHTTGAGTNRLLIATISAYNSGGTPATCSGCTYNGIAMTQQITGVYTTSPQVRSYIFYLINPPSGGFTIRANFSASTVSVGGAVSYSGVDQATPIQTSSSATGSETNGTVSVAVTGSGRAVYGSLAGYRTSSSWTITENTGQSDRWNQIGQLYKGHGDEKLDVPSGVNSIGWGFGATYVRYVCLAAAINPAATVGHCDIDVLVRQSDGTVRSTLASNVATSSDLTAAQTTLTGSYSWGAYTVVSDTDYLEIDYYVDVTVAVSGKNAYLRIDDTNLAAANQTRTDNIMLPSEYTVEVEFSGTSNTQSWAQVVWTVDSAFTAAGVTATFQLYNCTAGTYPTGGNGYITDTIGTSNITETQTITTNPTQFRDAGGNWKMKIKGVKTTTSQYDWRGDLTKYQVTGSSNYELDLEEQWINVNYTSPEEKYLCIKTGTLGFEANNTHSLDATGGYMIVGSGTPNWGSTAGTISFWIKWDTVANRPWGQHDNMETRISGSNLVLDWGATGAITSTTSFTTGKWFFIAIVWNENTHDLYLYVGDQNNQPTEDEHVASWTSTVSDKGVTQNNFMASRGGNGPVDGHGDELRYWNVDRSLAEIQSDYKKELTGSEANLRSYFKLNSNFADTGPAHNDGSGSGSYSFSSDVPFTTSSTENLRVDVWNGSAWQNLFTNLMSGWNNASVTSYVTSSSFTMRFKGSNETSDTIQDSWQIDATLLRFGFSDKQLSDARDTIVIELLQNGTLRWLGQSLNQTQTKPIPPLPTKSIRVNQTTDGVNCEVPFQIEDWASDYMIPLGLTSNSSVFSDRTMLVFLANNNVSKVTISWNGSDSATQTSNAYTNRYFTGDDPSTGKLTNGKVTLQIGGDFTLNSTVANASCKATFMRINNQPSGYGSGVAYAITGGIVRDVIHQEAEWSNGVTSCPDFYAHIVLTLPANVTYYTYQLRLMFVDSKQSRSIADLCPIKLETSINQIQTENGTTNGYPVVSASTSLFYNMSTAWAHHWSQFVSGTKGAGIMFTNDANGKLYFFDTLAGSNTGGLKANSTRGTIELLPVAMAPVSFTYPLDVAWFGAVSTFDNTTAVYQETNGVTGGSWISVEYPPTITLST